MSDASNYFYCSVQLSSPGVGELTCPETWCCARPPSDLNWKSDLGHRWRYFGDGLTILSSAGDLYYHGKGKAVVPSRFILGPIEI